jgi:hypothetical protein
MALKRGSGRICCVAQLGELRLEGGRTQECAGSTKI